MDRPLIAVTMGDPSGIGPEVTVKALSNPEITKTARCVVIGDSGPLKYAVKVSKLPGVMIHPVKDISQARCIRNQIDVLDLKNVDMRRLKLGTISSMSGKASVQYIEKAVELAKKGEVAALVTGPISKEAIHRAGYKFDGHTELLAKRTNTKKFAMLFISDKLWVMLATTHMPLKEVARNISKKRVLDTINMAHDALKRSGRPRARIAVAGLNPHAGESGLFGREEITAIGPAVIEAKKAGISVEGPISPDAVFSLANAGMYDMVVAMYHDQGLIPLKLLSFNRSVNVTYGLPVIRTSVDHGTGFDIVGKGWANPGSLTQAIKVAAHFAKSR